MCLIVMKRGHVGIKYVLAYVKGKAGTNAKEECRAKTKLLKEKQVQGSA